ncbi:MAG: hypothetical protein BAJALOKI1v1_640013 [Promethearchaeota archaeon]|nr:MAG: hypothetical protein BAJALOKI1v1_640013 [Candidatus Lokiarchaeota archaeon]
MNLFGKKEEEEEAKDSPKHTLGFSGDLNSIMNHFYIKKYELNTIDQLTDIKHQLRARKILIIDVQKVLEGSNAKILEFKEVIDELKNFVRQNGGSIGRLGKKYLILTPSAQIRISN